MRKITLCILGCLILTGCSELQVIGKATLRELTAESISVEGERYRAGAERRRLAENQAFIAKASVPADRIAKVEQKELWRHY